MYQIKNKYLFIYVCIHFTIIFSSFLLFRLACFYFLFSSRNLLPFLLRHALRKRKKENLPTFRTDESLLFLICYDFFLLLICHHSVLCFYIIIFFP